MASFYYSSRRLGGHDSRATASQAAASSATDRPLGDDGDVVRFDLPAGAEIVVPAARLDVVRCVAECLTRATSVAARFFAKSSSSPANVGVLEGRVAAHEALHRFFGWHHAGRPESNEGIMDAMTAMTQENITLTGRQIKKAQETENP